MFKQPADTDTMRARRVKPHSGVKAGGSCRLSSSSIKLSVKKRTGHTLHTQPSDTQTKWRTVNIVHYKNKQGVISDTV